MYSQPWSPSPSTTVIAPELRTAKRSPARPRKNARPEVAPYSTVLPTITLCSAANAGVGRRAHHDRPAGEALAAVVVRVAVEHQLHAARQPGAEALPGRAGERHVDAALGQAVLAVHARDLAGQEAAHGAVLVLDPALEPHRPALLDRGAAELEQVHVDRVVEHRVRAAHAVARRVRARRCPAPPAARAGRCPAPSSARRRAPRPGARCARSARACCARRGFAMIRRASSATMKR